ncbi:hypothetical protein SBOR_6918 [Sclerotinia borealis F-4128]|uniref:CCHC-type domain-containing protein n=1 Tax=Sclerotinia borealis (strain F-4128) TaxID=1432307 RepID=W9CA30_SCLBF|nr:hypothetical protein SBOR_6918 [Sclerotinia borealis F-4128]
MNTCSFPEATFPDAPESSSGTIDKDDDIMIGMVAQHRRQDRGQNDQSRHQSFERDQRPYSSSQGRFKGCYNCEEETHITQNCPYKESIRKFVRDLIKKSPMPPSKHMSASWCSHEASPNNNAFRPTRKQGYTAAKVSDKKEIQHFPSEFAHLSFHGNTKQWIADTGIKAGGGELIAKEHGIVEIAWNEIEELEKNKTWRQIFNDGTNNLARLVARGFTQRFGIDFFDTFAPTVQQATVRSFLSIVASQDLEAYYFDIKNAFTEAELKEKIFLSAPKGVQVKPGHILQILRSLYSLKQAARDWNDLIKKSLIGWGFTQSLTDPCLFTHKERGIIILLYVDDLPVAAKNLDDLMWFSKQLTSVFKAKNLGEIENSKLLGMRIKRDKKNRTFYVDQEQYLEKVLNRHGFTKETSKPIATLMEGYDSLRPAKEDDKRADPTKYSRIIGELMYTMVYSRPDIAFGLGKLNQYMKDPAEIHMHKLRRVIRYLRTTIRYRLRFGPGGVQNLVMYSDADYASEIVDRKSTSGVVALLGGGPVFWMSRKQNSVSTSTTERHVADDGFAIEMKRDNQGTIALVKNAQLTDRSKHIDVAYHHVRDLNAKGKVNISYIPTDKMIADGLTKPLVKDAFRKFIEMLGMVDSPDPTPVDT